MIFSDFRGFSYYLRTFEMSFTFKPIALPSFIEPDFVGVDTTGYYSGLAEYDESKAMKELCSFMEYDVVFEDKDGVQWLVNVVDVKGKMYRSGPPVLWKEN